MKHIHIVGCSPRSGTSLLQELMVNCFYIDDYCAHEQSIFRSSKLTGSLVCTKNPREVPYAKGILAINPELYVLYLSRDPRNVITSKHGKSGDLYYSALYVWNEYEEFKNKLLDHPRFIVVKYEDIVNNPDLLQKQLMEKLPILKFKHKFSEFHMHAKPSGSTSDALNGLRPISNSGLNKWKQHLPRIKAQILKYGNISKNLIDLGYETDNKWENLLKDASLGETNSEIDGNFHSAYTLKMKYRIFRKLFVYFIQIKAQKFFKNSSLG